MKNYSLFMIFVFAGQLGMADVPNIQMPPAKQIPELVRNGKQLEKLTGDSTWPRRYGVHFKMEASEHQEIGNAILELHREGVLKTKKSQKKLFEIVDTAYRKIDTPANQVMNYTAMKSRYKKVTNFDRVFASIILLANYGDFSYIEPFLLFAKVYYGGAPKEFPDPFQSTFISESGHSEGQDYSIWPAGYVILKHRDKAMPMLIQAAKNTSLNKVLRVRALAFIRDINETVFMNNVLTALGDEFKKEAQESLRYGKSWKTILLLKADPASVEKRRLFYERIMKKRMGGTSVNQQR